MDHLNLNPGYYKIRLIRSEMHEDSEWVAGKWVIGYVNQRQHWTITGVAGYMYYQDIIDINTTEITIP